MCGRGLATVKSSELPHTPFWRICTWPDSASGNTPYRLYNIGNSKPVKLTKFIEVLERCLGKKAKMNLLPLQPGDVPITYADIDDLTKDIDFRPSTTIEEGVKKFTEWYLSYYRNV